jgi:hypothetical protein
MLSPKNHIRGECLYIAIMTGVEHAAVQPNKKAGVKPAFSVLVG